MILQTKKKRKKDEPHHRPSTPRARLAHPLVLALRSHPRSLAVANADGEIIVDNPRFVGVDRPSMFSLDDTELKIHDLL